MRRLHCNSAPVVCSPLLKSSKLSADHKQRKPTTERNSFWAQMHCNQIPSRSFLHTVPITLPSRHRDWFSKLVTAWCLLHKTQFESGKLKDKTLYSRLFRRGNSAHSSSPCPCTTAGRLTSMWSGSREIRADSIQSAFVAYEVVQIFNNGKCMKYLWKVILQDEDLLMMVMKEYFFFFLPCVSFFLYTNATLHKC